MLMSGVCHCVPDIPELELRMTEWPCMYKDSNPAKIASALNL